MDQVRRCSVSALRPYSRKFLTSRSQANRITRLAPEGRHGAMGARPQPSSEGSNRLVTSCRPLYPPSTNLLLYLSDVALSAGLQRPVVRSCPRCSHRRPSPMSFPIGIRMLHRTARAKGGPSRSFDRRCCASQYNEPHRPPSLRTISHRRIFEACTPSIPKPNAATRVINAATVSSSLSALWSIVERSLTGDGCARNEVDAHRAR
jgi:hypothetical protein